MAHKKIKIEQKKHITKYTKANELNAFKFNENTIQNGDPNDVKNVLARITKGDAKGPVVHISNSVFNKNNSVQISIEDKNEKRKDIHLRKSNIVHKVAKNCAKPKKQEKRKAKGGNGTGETTD